MTAGLPTIAMFPTITRCELRVVDDENCVVEIFAGDLSLFEEHCRRDEPDRLADLLEVARRAMILQQKGADDGQKKHRRQVVPH